MTCFSILSIERSFQSIRRSTSTTSFPWRNQRTVRDDIGGPRHDVLPFFGLLLVVPNSIQFFLPGLSVQYWTTNWRCTFSTFNEPERANRSACDRSTESLWVRTKL